MAVSVGKVTATASKRHPQRCTGEFSSVTSQPITFDYRFLDLEALETPKYGPNGIHQAVLLHVHLQELTNSIKQPGEKPHQM